MMETENKEKDLQSEEIVEEKDVSPEKEEKSKKEKKNKHKEQIDALEKEIKELKDKLLRNAAELDNFKKRMTQERINDRKYASKNLVHDILEPLDQLDKIVNIQTDDATLKNFLYGFKMINDKFYQVLITDG